MRAVRISTDTLKAAKLSLRVIAVDANGWRRRAYRRAAADMCSNGSPRYVCTRMRFGCTKCEILGGAGIIGGEIFRIFCRNFSESVRGELHNAGFVRFYMR